MDLQELGWDDFFAAAFEPLAGADVEPARVVTEHRGGYRVVCAQGEMAGEVSGRFRHEATAAAGFPAVGDWVAVKAYPSEARAVIQAVLPRRTRFARTAPGRRGAEQVLAANIDDVFIACALTDLPNLRRLERFLAMAWASGAQPLFLLTKADLCADAAASVRAVQEIAAGVPVFAVSGVTGAGMSSLKPFLRRARTIVVLGPSGVGKSTLINHCCGEEMLHTLPVRDGDHKGRHTTTERQMIPLPSGALIIDTPGLRELHLWEGEQGVEESFADLELVAVQCRFADCRHEAEPECAVRAAIAAGTFAAARLASYQKLKREVARASGRHIQRVPADERRRNKSFAKEPRALLKARKRR